MTTRREFLKTAACVPLVGIPTFGLEVADESGRNDCFGQLRSLCDQGLCRTIMQRTSQLICEKDGTTVNLGNLNNDDPDTFAMIGEGNTADVFQLEEIGMRTYLRRLKPINVYELIAAIVLYRPSPIELGYFEAYINRKHGRETVAYIHPVHEEVLGETFGILLYQEQAIQLLHRIGGIDPSEGPSVIRAIAKKKTGIIDDYESRFMDEARRRGFSRDVAEYTFGCICFFGGYTYSKSHAVATTSLTYQAAYLKAHYPDEFAAAVAEQVKSWSNQP